MAKSSGGGGRSGNKNKVVQSMVKKQSTADLLNNVVVFRVMTGATMSGTSATSEMLRYTVAELKRRGVNRMPKSFEELNNG